MKRESYKLNMSKPSRILYIAGKIIFSGIKQQTNILLFLLSLLIIPSISSCERDKDSEGISKITYFPDFTMNGDEVIILNKGDKFVDPGVSAKENGIELPVKTSIKGDFFPASSIDVNMPNRYIINYLATNKDGFDGSIERTVYVVSTGDLVNNIEGLYTSTVIRNGVSAPQYENMEYIMIRKVGDNENVYELSDGIGGYYDLGRSYGADYRATGAQVTANNISKNDFDLSTTFGVGAFGGDANITSFTVDAANKTIHMVTSWDSGTDQYTFDITLTQVKL
jgi:hypothetical protein